MLLIFSGHRWRARTTNYTPDNWQLTWFRFLDLHHLAPAVTLINRRGLFSDYPPVSPHLLSPSHSVNHWNLTLIFRVNKHQPKVYILDEARAGAAAIFCGLYLKVTPNVCGGWWPRLRRWTDWRRSPAPTPTNKSHTAQRRRPAHGDNQGQLFTIH